MRNEINESDEKIVSGCLRASGSLFYSILLTHYRTSELLYKYHGSRIWFHTIS